MKPYKPIEVEAAKQIAETHDKQIVIIIAWEMTHGLLHVTTYGDDPGNKALAAAGGEVAIAALGGIRSASLDFEDFRLQQAHALLAALKSALAIVAEARSAWEQDREMSCGKILTALIDPTFAYRADISQIHTTLAAAEKFLASTSDSNERGEVV